MAHRPTDPAAVVYQRIRSNPAYNDMSDQQLVDAVNRKLYPSVPQSQFYQRIGFDPAKSAALSDARKLVEMSPGLDRSINSGATYGLSPLIDAAKFAGATAIANSPIGGLLGAKKQPYSSGTALQAFRQARAEGDSQFAQEHPVQAFGGNLFGGVLAPGGTTIAKGIDSIAFSNPAIRIAAKGLLGAGTGGVIGATAGAASSDPGDEVNDAVKGGLFGTVLGVGAPAIVQGVGLGLKAGAKVATYGARAANKMADGAFLDPMRVAGQRLTEAMNADKLDPTTQRTILNGWMSKGITPSLVDLAGPGSRTAQVLRQASLNSTDARPIIHAYGDKTMGQVQRNAADAVRQLTPGEARPAPAVADAWTNERGTLANQEYPKGVAVPTAPIADQLSGAPGAQAINSAKYTADVYGQGDQLSELGALKKAANPGNLPPLPPGTENLGPQALDQIRQQLGLGYSPAPELDIGTLKNLSDSLNAMGSKAMEHPDTARNAPGLFARAKAIDDHLSSINGDYATADQNFAQRSRNIDSLNVGSKGYDLPTHEYTSALDTLTPPMGHDSVTAPDLTGTGAGVGFRSRMVDQIRSQNPGDMGVLKTIGTNPDIADNLALTFGNDAADQLVGQGTAADNARGQINLLRDRAATARQIDTLQGSPTALNLKAGEDPIGLPDLSPHGLLKSLIDKINVGAQLTDAEQKAIAQLGTSPAPDVLSTLQQSRSSPQVIQDAMKDNGTWYAQQLRKALGSTVAPALSYGVQQ